MGKLITFVFITSFILGITSTPFTLEYPEYFPEPHYKLDANPLTQEKINIGRALFFDPLLSKDNSTSCASCHSPHNAFAHTDHDLSHGINDEIGTRNAPALFNLAWHKNFMWGGAIRHLDMQSLAPIEHPKEMGEKFKEILDKLKDSKIYRELFDLAYEDGEINGERFLKCFSQFQLTLISANSKYDRVQREEDAFTPQEYNGYTLFKTHCASCHKEPLFTNAGFANNGLPVDTTLNDIGRMAITNNPSDSLVFKVPSLRNLEYSYPYMHDGRFARISEVINHYLNGIEHTVTLSEELKTPIVLSSNEKVDLLSFLLTLNDEEFVFNPDFQYPKEILLPSKD